MIKKIFRYFILVFVAISILIVICNTVIISSSNGRVFNSFDSIPSTKVGLLLGTSKLLSNGNPNPYFEYRIDAATRLFKAKKIEYILVSGDNGSIYYDEPNDFKTALIESGIPKEKIVLDYAGFRTFDSVIRAKKVFGQKSLIVISQKFHNQRAVYLAQKNGIKAYGYNAKTVKGNSGLKVELREYLARTKVFIDLLFGVEPQFLGEKVIID